MNIKQIFKTAFPFINAALSVGGPLGTMAAAVVGTAMGVENLPVDGIEDAIALATTKDPEMMLKLRQAEQSFELQMKQLGFDSVAKIEEIHAADRANARAREMAVKDATPRQLAWLVTIGFFVILLLLTFFEVPASTKDLLMIMAGVLGTQVNGVYNYYFGSSAGSAAKTQIMANGHGAK